MIITTTFVMIITISAFSISMAIIQFIVTTPVFCFNVNTSRFIFSHLLWVCNSSGNRHFNITFNCRKIINILFRTECICFSRFSSTSSSTNSVNIVFCFYRKIVVNYHCKVINVNTTGSHISCNKAFYFASLQRFQNLQTFCLW